jgi:hypothetical protein
MQENKEKDLRGGKKTHINLGGGYSEHTEWKRNSMNEVKIQAKEQKK